MAVGPSMKKKSFYVNEMTPLSCCGDFERYPLSDQRLTFDWILFAESVYRTCMSTSPLIDNQTGYQTLSSFKHLLYLLYLQTKVFDNAVNCHSVKSKCLATCVSHTLQQ